MGDETTEQKTTIPEMSPEEQKLQAQALAMLGVYMSESGYDLKPKETYENPARVSALETDRDNTQRQIDELTAQANDPRYAGNRAALQNQIRNAQSRLGQINTDLETEQKKVRTEYDVELNETGRKLQEMRGQALTDQAEVNRMFMETTKKFLNGDYSINADQQKAIQDSMKSIRDAVTPLLDEVNNEAAKTETDVGLKLDEYMKAVKDTGLSIGAALDAVSARVQDTKEGILGGIGEEEKRIGETGASIKAAITGLKNEIDNTGGQAKDALEKAFVLHRTLAKQGMEDYYQQQRKDATMRAAALGRSSLDPQFQAEMQSAMMKAINTTELQMAEQEALQMVGLLERTGMRQEEAAKMGVSEAERTGSRMEEAARLRTAAEAEAGAKEESIAQQRVGLAERQGTAAEQVAMQKAQLAERTGGIREATAGQKATMEENLQTTGQNMRWQMGMGIPAQAIGIGMNVADYQRALSAQGSQNALQASQAGMPQQEIMFRERAAQPTTTTTTSGDPFGTFLGAVGGLAGGAGSIMSGVGAMQGGSFLGDLFRKSATGKTG